MPRLSSSISIAKINLTAAQTIRKSCRVRIFPERGERPGSSFMLCSSIACLINSRFSCSWRQIMTTLSPEHETVRPTRTVPRHQRYPPDRPATPSGRFAPRSVRRQYSPAESKTFVAGQRRRRNRLSIADRQSSRQWPCIPPDRVPAICNFRGHIQRHVVSAINLQHFDIWFGTMSRPNRGLARARPCINRFTRGGKRRLLIGGRQKQHVSGRGSYDGYARRH